MEVAIVGGGIAGLALALNLHERGIACRVFEAAPEVKELGVGITLLPHAMRELARSGSRSAIRAVAHRERGELLLQPLRPAHLQGAARRYRRLSLSRSSASIAAGCIWRSTRRRSRRWAPERVVTDRHCVGVEQDERPA